MTSKFRWTMRPVALGTLLLAAFACGSDDDSAAEPAGPGASDDADGNADSTEGSETDGSDDSDPTSGDSDSSSPSTEGNDDETSFDGSGEAGGEGSDDGDDVAPAPWEDGITVTSGLEDDDRFHGVALDGAGNAYAVGYVAGESRRMLVAKYAADGTPDAEFGGQDSIAPGMVAFDFSPYVGDGAFEEASDVALQSDGSIVVVGRAKDPSVAEPDADTPGDIVVFRLAADGARDLSFGGDGLVVIDTGGADDQAWGISVDASDRVYLFGHGTTRDAARTDRDRYVWRLAADGSVDEGFATAGAFSFDVPEGDGSLALNDTQRRGMVVPDALGGGVVLGGYTNVEGQNEVVLAKLDADGSPDPGFSSDGIMRLAPFPTGMAEAYGAVLQSDGSIVTTGYGNVDLERGGGAELLDLVSFRIAPSGEPDPTWAVEGSLVYNPADGQDRGRALAALSDDRILMVGTVTVSPGDKDAMLLLVNADGSISENFAGGAHKAYDFSSVDEEWRSVTVGDGVAAAAGYSVQGAGADGILVLLPLGE